MSDHGLLTSDEHRAMDLTAELVKVLNTIVGRGLTRTADVGELLHHVHEIQNAILAQAAGRAYPDRYRRLGEVMPAGQSAVSDTVASGKDEG